MNNKGKIIYTSWGYDMTHNDYAVIIEETEKTVKCRMLKTKVLSDCGDGNGKSMPSLEETGETFRLHKRGDWFKGSYPFCGNSRRLDSFSLWDGKANYYNTYD
jgi:hypothetical protein